ncbi:MAG: ATP-binding protein, partial [Bacteroidaceae bacterium]|nr:ATP-binding protein [Bacteroidaceae bacterium]
MTKEELLKRISGVEWEDFECKEALDELPKNVWDSVSAFSNTAGGWVVLGIKETKKKTGSVFTVTGVNNPEKMEQDFISTLRSKTKFNTVIFFKVQMYDIDGHKVLAFWIPSSSIKPVYFNNNIQNTFIRCGSGD